MPTHHPTIAALPDLTSAGEKIVDQQFRDRLGTLLSIDDLVAGETEPNMQYSSC